jgi:ribosomal protein S6--L-glutamate ligase
MKIAILSQDSTLYSTRRLREAAEARGHTVRVIDYLRCYINVTSRKPMVFYAGKPLDDIDAIIPRVGASHTFYGTAIVRQFEMMGVFSSNGSQAISRSRDKLRCLQILAREGVGLPVTGYANTTQDHEGLIKMVGGAPLVIKLVEGTQGIGVVLAETPSAAKSVIEAFRGLSANILVQEYIKEANGEDLRCFVVGGRVVGAMKRTAAPGEFRANIHRGGTAEEVTLTPEEKTTAKLAAKAMGLKVAGVDLLRSKSGPLVLEVNSSPGLEGIEKATKKDIASEIIAFTEKHAKAGASRDRIPQ